MKGHFRLLILFVTLPLFALGQTVDTVRAGRFDNGKMWTFDFPPVDYFEKAYGFRPTQQWLDEARMSALRFANYCSASFVSADGLVMTNHHCARQSGTAVQKPGEDFNNNGFLARTLEEERPVAGLYVDQLVMIEDITARVQKATEAGKTDEEKVQKRNQEFDAIRAEYGQKEGWKGLELQTLTFYWGGKYSLYGFKRYRDVRLVMMPELAMGFFGGDYDNFTYPRYCLDFSFFRVYDETGKPMKTAHYFKFNPKGAAEGDPVFVIGNPGSTNRQATVAILDYFKDLSWPTTIKRMSARSDILQEYNSKARNDSILNVVFSFENSLKAIGGMLGGVRDPYIYSRRKAFEKDFKGAVEKNNKLKSQAGIWDEIAVTQKEISFYDANVFNTNGYNSKAFDLAVTFYLYATTTDPQRSTQLKEAIQKFKNPPITEIERKYLAQHFKEAGELLGAQDPYVKMVRGIKENQTEAIEYPKNVNTGDPQQIADALLKETKLYDKAFREELLAKGPQEILASKDPLLKVGRIAGKRFDAASTKNRATNAKLSNLRSRLALLLFEVYGTDIPPDATFSLRIADGVVKSYEYNGTLAPVHTTFFGMYDRYYSFNQQYPWNLPEKWKNPPMELLSQPVDFISTNDIIGGNSGSPMINKNREVVGLIFDGNMESLPGNYIFLPESNRTVSVHAGGILAGLKYIYKADRIVAELTRP